MSRSRARSFRIDDELWLEGIEAANAMGTDLSAELRGFVERLVRTYRAGQGGVSDE